MPSRIITNSVVRTMFVAFLVFGILGLQSVAVGQSDQRTKAIDLIKSQKLTEALPLLEELAKTTPNDAEIQFYLGIALLAQATNTNDKLTAQKIRVRARQAFIKARELGDDRDIVRAAIETIPEDGSADAEAKFSQNPDAERLMGEGEAAFSRGELDKALGLYQKALSLDPKLYEAALFAGDVNVQLAKYADAETWYQKAVAIDPYRETAYRYSATPFMKQGKYDQARDRYVEAFIVSPYNRLATGGLIQWAQVTKKGLGHPQIDIPKTTVGADGKENTTINVNPLADDGSMAWIAYSATRLSWKKEKFAKTFPAEKAYRHTLAEEVDALRSVVSLSKTVKSKSTNEQIALLEKMDKEGLLEAYVLLAIPDAGIARDHAAYLRANREKLRQYVIKYVIAN